MPKNKLDQNERFEEIEREEKEAHKEQVEVDLAEVTDPYFEPKLKSNSKYRYFCDACTNIAFFANKAEEELTGHCAVCGKPYTTRKENYIKL